MGYTGPATPYFPYSAPPVPDPPKHGRWPVAAYHTVVQDLLLGIALDQRGSAGLGTGAGTVARTVEMRYDQRLTYNLFDAAVRGHQELVISALDQQADPNARESESGMTALHLAAMHSESPAVIQLLHAAGTAIDGVDAGGKTPLMGALAAGHDNSVMTLLFCNSDLEKLKQPASRRHALNVCLRTCPPNPGEDYVKMTEKLVNLAASSSSSGPTPSAGIRGPPAEQVTNQMRNSVMACISNNWTGGLTALLSARANPCYMDKKCRRSALDLADAMLNTKAGDILRKFGADTYRRPDHESWALCFAAARGDWSAAVFFGKACELDYREPPPSDRMTALHYAAIEGHKEIARLLVKSGHSVDLLDQRALSPAGLARLRGHHALADYLQELETESLWRRSEDLAREYNTAPQDFMPRSSERADDGRRWPVLKDLLMPPRGEELKWEEEADVVISKDIEVDASTLKVKVISARNLEAGTLNWSLEPYVKLKIRDQTKFTSIINSNNPMYNEDFEFAKVRPRDVLIVTVWDKDYDWVDGLFGSQTHHSATEGDTLLGRLEIHLKQYKKQLYAGRVVEIRQMLDHQLKGQKQMVNINISMPSKEIFRTGSEEPKKQAAPASFF